jgi:hypothetical protein
VSRKPERQRAGDNPIAVPVKSKSAAEANSERALEKRSEAASGNPQTEKRPVVTAKAPAVAGHEQERANSAPRKQTPRLGAPSIRFPNPEFRNHSPIPLPSSRFRGSAAERPAYSVA